MRQKTHRDSLIWKKMKNTWRQEEHCEQRPTLKPWDKIIRQTRQVTQEQVCSMSGQTNWLSVTYVKHAAAWKTRR